MVTLSCTAVVINYRTELLTHRAVASLRRFYPSLPLLLIDNGSTQQSAAALRRTAVDTGGPTELLCNSDNLHHGPAMDQGARRLETDFLLFLDSDCELTGGGIVEALSDALTSHEANYAAGKRTFMNRRGFDVEDSPSAVPYIRPICMMLRRSVYLDLPPFEKHGAPCLANMAEAYRRGYGLIHVPVEEYVRHEGRGTAGQFGYGLGWRGKLNYILNRAGL